VILKGNQMSFILTEVSMSFLKKVNNQRNK